MTGTSKKQFPVRMFIGERQVGDNATFSETAVDVETAIAQILEVFPKALIVTEMLVRWEGQAPELTIVVKR